MKKYQKPSIQVIEIESPNILAGSQFNTAQDFGSFGDISAEDNITVSSKKHFNIFDDDCDE